MVLLASLTAVFAIGKSRFNWFLFIAITGRWFIAITAIDIHSFWDFTPTRRAYKIKVYCFTGILKCQEPNVTGKQKLINRHNKKLLTKPGFFHFYFQSIAKIDFSLILAGK
jgi:hypothetical protein